MNYTSIIIPLYNEETRIDYCFDIIIKLLQKKEKIFKEIIFVNDGSTDKSKNTVLEFIKKVKKRNFNIKLKLISYSKNKGKGYALKRGILSSKFDWILTCDLDMSVLPEQYLIWNKRKLIKDTNYAYIASRNHKKSKVKSKFLRRRLGDIFRLILFILFNIRILFRCIYYIDIVRGIKINSPWIIMPVWISSPIIPSFPPGTVIILIRSSIGFSAYLSTTGTYISSS